MDSERTTLTWNDLSKPEQQFMLFWYPRGTVTHHKGSKIAKELIQKGLLSSVGLVEGRYVTRTMTEAGRWLCESETYAT